MPVLPSVTWSTAVRLTSAAAHDSGNANDDSSAVPARAADAWMNWRRLMSLYFERDFFIRYDLLPISLRYFIRLLNRDRPFGNRNMQIRLFLNDPVKRRSWFFKRVSLACRCVERRQIPDLR